MSISIDIWGPNIWYLFHTIAYKLKESSFDIVKKNIFDITKSICNTLPCDECSKHAITLLSKYNFDTIKNKKDLIKFYYNFHNFVNKKLNKSIFDEEKLEELYNKANFNNIYNNFIKIYNTNNNVPQMMNSSFIRKKELQNIILNINIIKEHFN